MVRIAPGVQNNLSLQVVRAFLAHFYARWWLDHQLLEHSGDLPRPVVGNRWQGASERIVNFKPCFDYQAGRIARY